MFLSSDKFVRQNSETHWKGEILKKMKFLMYFKYFSAITIKDLFMKTIPGNKAWIITHALSLPRIPRNPETKWRFALENATPNLCWVSCAINKGGFFRDCIFVVVVVVDTHLPRFEALAHVLPHFDALTHFVIRVSSAFIFQTFAEVCYSVVVNRSFFISVLHFRKAYIFKSSSLLKVYYRFVFNESSKAFIFQKCASPGPHNRPEARF